MQCDVLIAVYVIVPTDCEGERVLIHLELNFKNLHSLIPNKLTMKRSNLKFPSNRSPIKSAGSREITFSHEIDQIQAFRRLLRDSPNDLLFRELRGNVWRLSRVFQLASLEYYCLVSILHRGSLEKILDERRRTVPAGGTILRLDTCVTDTDSIEENAYSANGVRPDDP